MRRLAGFCMTVAVLALALGCGKKDSTESGGGGGGGTSGTSSSGIEGTYLIVGMENEGTAIPAEFISKGPEDDRTITVTGDKFLSKKGGKDDPATYKVNSSKDPKEIDFTAQKTIPSGPPAKGAKGKAAEKDKEKTVEEKMYGIYKLEGDKLIICMTEGKPENRPKEFKTTAENKAMMMTLQKKK